MSPAILASEAHLFPVRDAYRFRPITAPSTTYDDPTTGENPKYGASINYYLKAPVPGGVTVTILDDKGAVVRSFPGTNVAGVNRQYWDLRHEPSAEVRLLTSPLYADHIVPGPNGRVAPGTSRLAVLATPGRYTVRITAGAVEQSQPLLLKKDPNTGGTEAEIAEQTRALLAIRKDLNEAAAAVQRVESARVQLQGIIRAVDDTTVRRAASRLAQQLTDLEMNMVDLRQTGTGQDGVRFASKLIAKLNYLANGMSGSDYRPTNQHGEVQGILNTELKGTPQHTGWVVQQGAGGVQRAAEAARCAERGGAGSESGVLTGRRVRWSFQGDGDLERWFKISVPLNGSRSPSP